jgi:hypothetical protein
MLNISQQHKRILTLQQQTTPAPRYVGVRVKHDAEMPMAWREKYGPNLRNGLPEVYVLSETVVYMNEEIQWLCFNLFYSQAKAVMTLSMAQGKFRVLYDYMRAFSNKTGYGGEEADPPLPPRWDYISDLNRGAELPAFDKVRVCGGAFLTGRQEGKYFIADTLSPAAVPSLEWLLAHPQFYFHAVNTTAKGISKFPQAGGMPVLIPLFSRFEARIPMEQVVPWESNELPDPYRIYLPAAV